MNLGHAKEPKLLFPAVRSNKNEATVIVEMHNRSNISHLQFL
jgi:hypothetical protein